MKAGAVVRELQSALGPLAVKTENEDISPYLVDWRGLYRGAAICVVEPSTTDEVAVTVRIASAHGVRVVPQGGNTGLVGGGVPLSADVGGLQIVVSLRRLNRIRDIDVLDNVIIAEAGVVLEHAQLAAGNAGRLLPISLAAEGSAQIGGIISTNAGGTNVLRFGSTRELVLGLEVVLADGTVWNGLERLRKNNTGYDLKQLFIGSEGTLGIVTAAAIKLFPQACTCVTALIAVPSPDAAVRLLRSLQSDLGDFLTAFELIERVCLDLVFNSIDDARDPFENISPWYVLAEVSTAIKELALNDFVEASLAVAFEEGLATDAVLAQSEKQRTEIWRLRESISEAERQHGPSVKHDISIPVAKVSPFLARAPEIVRSCVTGARPIAFGHVGDGNIHYNVFARVEDTHAINGAVYDLVATLGGSISAEHGIGLSKIGLLPLYKDRTSMALMRKLRMALDPATILNPGKVIKTAHPNEQGNQ